MGADAEITAWLLGNDPDKTLGALCNIYDDAVVNLPQSQREWDSVVTQLRLLAKLLRLRIKAEGSDKAEILTIKAELLTKLAQHLQPAATSGDDSQSQQTQTNSSADKKTHDEQAVAIETSTEKSDNKASLAKGKANKKPINPLGEDH